MAVVKTRKVPYEFFIDDFSGGLVTNLYDEKLKFNEFITLQNADYLVRGGLIKRPGFSNVVPDNQSLLDLGIPQVDIDAWFTASNFVGTQQSITKIFAKKYTRKVGGEIEPPEITDEDYEIIICAIDGKLVVFNYIEPTVENDLTHPDGDPTFYPSRVLYSGFQNTNVFKTGQGLSNTLIATPGDAILRGRLVYDEATGFTTFEVETLNSVKKIPTVIEYGVLGGNVLATNPFDDVTDEFTASSFKVLNIRSNPVISYLNNETTFVAYGTFTLGAVTDYDFQWSVKKPGETSYTIIQAWANGSAGKTFKYTPDTLLNPDGSASDESLNYANYAIKVEARETATPANTSELEITNHKVTEIDTNVPFSSNQVDVNKCIDFEVSDDRIKFFNNGSPLVYKSALKNETYILTNGILNFDTIKTENVTAVVSYRNGKLVFTPTTCHVVRGFGDDIPDSTGRFDPYLSQPISTDIGCIAPLSVAVADDIVFFLSDNGIYALDTLAVDQNRAEVIKVSDNIDNIAFRDTNAVGVVYNNKYYLFYPDRRFSIKLDYIYGRKIQGSKIPDGPFTTDVSDFIDFHYVAIINNSLVGLSKAKDIIMQQNVISLPATTNLNRLEDVVFDDGFFEDDGTPYDKIVASKRYSSVDLTTNLNQSSINKRMKQVYANIQQYSKSQIKYFLEVFTEFGKIVNVISTQNTIEDVGGERAVVVNTIATYNVLALSQFRLGVPEFDILGTSELGFFDSVVSMIPLTKSQISKSFKFVFKNDLDQPAVLTGFGAYFITYGRPRE